MSWVTFQVYSGCPESLYRFIHDIPGHFTGVFTISRVTLLECSRCPRSLNSCIYDVPGHLKDVFTMSRVSLKVYSRYSGSIYRCIHDISGHFTGVSLVWICLWCDEEWCEFACGVMQKFVNMPLV